MKWIHAIAIIAILFCKVAAGQSYATCPLGQQLFWEGGGVIVYARSSPTCAGSSNDPPQSYIWAQRYTSPAQWASIVQAQCTGAAYGYTASIDWDPVRPCGSADAGWSIGAACMDATFNFTEGYPPYFQRDAVGLDANCAQGYFVLTPQVPNTGPQCPNCGDPINPGDGNEFHQETDYQSPDGRLSFTRAFNSASMAQSSLGSNWQHNFSSQATSGYSMLAIPPSGQTYVSALDGTTSATPQSACILGWPQIASTSPYPTATATFTNGICHLSNGVTLPVYSTDMSAAWTSVAGVSAAIAVLRPNGRVEMFTCANGSCVGRSNSPLTLSANSSSLVLVDEHSNTETYTTAGALTSKIYLDGYLLIFALD